MVRFKNRYLVFELSWADEDDRSTRITATEVFKALKESILLNFGDYALASVTAALQVKYVNEVTGLGIIRTPRDHFRTVWGAITFITQYGKKPVIVRVVHVGGTLRSCQRFAIRYNKTELLNLQADAQD